MDAIKEWHCWVAKEEHFDQAAHEAKIDNLVGDWRANYSNMRHTGLCGLPRYLQRPSARTLWNGASVAAAELEGKAFTKMYHQDAQAIFTKVHHHWHPNGEPLSHCVDKRHKKLATVKAKGLKKHARRKQATAGTHYA